VSDGAAPLPAAGDPGTPLIPEGLDATLVLLRHGESEWIVEHRFQGQAETPLSATETKMDDTYRNRQDPAVTVSLRLRSSDPLLDGGDGNDLIYGGYGDDTDTAADTLVGGDGNDTLRGEGGDDYIQTDGGADSAYGGAGNDSFYSLDGDGAGAGDFLDGGADSDTIIGTLDSSDTTVSIP